MLSNTFLLEHFSFRSLELEANEGLPSALVAAAPLLAFFSKGTGQSAHNELGK